MRKSTVRKIRQHELQNPDGMSSASFRRAKKDYSDGLQRLTEPRADKRPKGTPGFPKNRKPVLKTWVEKTGIERIVTSEVMEGKKRKRIPTRIIYKRKKVTRVVTEKV